MVISRSEESLDGRNLLIKDGKNFEGRPKEKKPRFQVKGEKPFSGPKPEGAQGARVEPATPEKVASKAENVGGGTTVEEPKKKKEGWKRKKEAAKKEKEKKEKKVKIDKA